MYWYGPCQIYFSIHFINAKILLLSINMELKLFVGNILHSVFRIHLQFLAKMIPNFITKHILMLNIFYGRCTYIRRYQGRYIKIYLNKSNSRNRWSHVKQFVKIKMTSLRVNTYHISNILSDRYQISLLIISKFKQNNFNSL